MDSKTYIREFEDADLKKVLQERDRIIEFMHNFEKSKLPKKYYERDPSPEEVYAYNLDYLKEICDLIKVKMAEKEEEPEVVDASPYAAIEKIVSKFDDAKQKEFLEELKQKDAETYYKFMEWKVKG